MVHFIQFGGIWDRLVALRNSVSKRAELVQKFVPRSRGGLFSQRRHPIHPIGPETDVFLHFVLFAGIWDRLVALRNSVSKRAELVQKFVPRSRGGLFRNERTRSIPVDPKPMFWYVSYYLGAFGTVWLRYETRCETGRTGPKVCATKSRRNFSQRRHPIHPIGP